MKKYITLPNILSAVIALIFLQSLPFKFSEAAVTQHIFVTLADWSGLDWFGAYGGYLVGTAELITAILLFTKLRSIGAIMAFGIISGAIFFHLFTPLGVSIPVFDGSGVDTGAKDPTLFIMACITWVSSAVLIFLETKNPDSYIAQFINR